MLTVGLVRRAVPEAVLQGKGSAQRKDKDGLPGWGVDTSYTARRNIWPLRHVGEPEAFCFCMYVQNLLCVSMCVCMYFFSFFSTFYVKCTYLTEGFTLFESSIRWWSWSYGALGPVVDGILVTIPWVPDIRALLSLGLWARTEKAISFTGIVTQICQENYFPQIWTSSYFVLLLFHNKGLWGGWIACDKIQHDSW